MSEAAIAAAAGAAAIAEAIKASGVLVRVEPEEFSKILNRIKDPLVVVAQGGFFNSNYRYLVSYKGLAFYTKTGAPLPLPGGTEVVRSNRISIPG
ncbi:MAG: hypothetical protein LAP40_21180 [Acidobacteriia bacterium]|nr:hypothetical protein [Terriglobia bacterium]